MSSVALIYAGIFIAAAVEGEMVFVAASVSVALGHLDFWGVLIAGALGGSAGDQSFFYAFRGPFKEFMDRFPRLASKRNAIGRLVETYAIPLAAACRFLPGLRIAIPAACAATVDPGAALHLDQRVQRGWVGRSDLGSRRGRRPQRIEPARHGQKLGARCVSDRRPRPLHRAGPHHPRRGASC